MTDVRLTALNPEDSKVYPVACNSSGELLVDKGEPVGPDLNVEGNLDVGGSATFANGKITAAGKIQSGGNANTGAAAGCINNPEGNFQVARSNAPGTIFQGYTVGTSAPTIVITAGGSITASGGITAGSDRYATKTGLGLKLGGTDYAFGAYVDSNNPVATIGLDGAATFSGDVVIGSRGEKWLIRESNGVAMLIQQTARGAKEPRIEQEEVEVRDLPRELDLVEEALSEIMGKLRMTPPMGWPVWDGSDETQ